MDVFFNDVPFGSVTRALASSGLRLTRQSNHDVAERLRAHGVAIFDRKNRRTSLSFTTVIIKTTVKDAEDGILDLAMETPTNADVKFVCGTGANLSTAWLRSAGINITDIHAVGCNIFASFDVVGGALERD